MRLQPFVAIQIATCPRVDVQPEVALAIAQALRKLRLRRPESRAICHVDLPQNLVIRCPRLEAGPGYLLQAAEAKACKCVCGVEAGIPTAWCAALSPTRRRGPVYRQIVAIKHLGVSGQQRLARALASWNASRESEAS